MSYSGMIGEHLGRYRVEEEVGQGGMSVVYRGRDTVLQRQVAIKVLHPHLQNRAESRARFEREAQAVAKLSHPNILQIYDFSEAGSTRSYIVTEFIRGKTLRDFIDDRPIAHPEVAAMMGVQLCEAVQHAHELGIIHRDIKPENVMICEDGVLKLMDFGIAQILDAHAMTMTGTLLGSPAHMSPEMIEGLPLDFRADVFSLGTLLYFAATGELPFTGSNPPLVLKAILEGNYTEAEMVNPRVGRTLSRIIDRCLERDAEDRFESMSALRDSLKAFLDDCNLGEVDAWLASYLVEARGTTVRLRGHLLEVLERRGREALKAGRVAQALEYFNRVLAIDPEHEQVLRLIRRIDMRRKVYVYVGAAAMLLVTASVVAWASADPDEPPERPTPAPVLAVDTAQVEDDARFLADATGRQSRKLTRDLAVAQEQIRARAVVAGQQQATSLRVSAESVAQAIAAPDADDPRASNGKNDPKGTARKDDKEALARAGDPAKDGAPIGDATPVKEVAVQEELVLVRFSLQNPKEGISVEVNGQPYTNAQLSKGVRVPRGLIKYTATHALCETWRASIPDGGRDLINVAVKLKFKPGALYVDSGEDRNAFVQIYDITGSQIAHGRSHATISVPIIDPESGRRSLKVNVIPSIAGARPALGRQVIVTAGRPTRLSVNLKP